MRVAVMQPYFYPYAGYFRLFAAADCFVVLDCVQFNRRGRVHRAQLLDARGGWLTLPLARQPRESLLRHAVGAAQVAAVGDRDAQVRVDAPERVAVRLNGASVATGLRVRTRAAERSVSFTVPASRLKDGANTVEVLDSAGQKIVDRNFSTIRQ